MIRKRYLSKESTLGKNSLVLLMHHDLIDLELICFIMVIELSGVQFGLKSYV